MYLSLLILNPLHGAARADAASPYELHRSLMRAFPTPLPPDERVLFRLELPERASGGQASVLVQSAGLPDWSPLVSLGAYLARPPAVKELNGLAFEPGQRLRFRLRGNPSKRDPRSGGRVALVRAEERLAWLQRKSETGGFLVWETGVSVRDTGLPAFDAYNSVKGEPGRRERARATIHMADFEGLLEVRDPAAFINCLRAGLGPANGRGGGRLSGAPAGGGGANSTC